MFKDAQATIEIDLSKSEDELFKQADKDARWGVKRAEKEGIIVEETKKESDLNRFYGIYKKTIVYGGIVPDNIDKMKKESYKLFVAKKDSRIIAGAIIEVVNNENFELKYNASLRSFLKFQPNNLLYWTLIRWGKKNGFRIFDFGGYQINAYGHLSGVNKFKERWGGQVKTYYITSWNPIYILGRKVIRNFPFIKNIRDKLKLKIYLSKEKYLENSIKKYGFSVFLKKVFKRYIYDTSSVILYSSDLNENKIIEPKINVKGKQIKSEEMWSLIENKNLISRELIEERFDEDNQCFVYLVDNELVHYSWIAFEEMNISEINMKIPLEKGRAAIYDCYTFEQFRGKDLYSSMLSKIKIYLKNKGFAKCYVYVESRNESSIKGIEKAGFKKEKILRYKNFLGLKSRKTEELK